MITLESLNEADVTAFTAALADVFEHAPWVPASAASARPFATVTALHQAMMDVVRAAASEQILAFLRGHPELSGQAALAGAMTGHSTAEQAALAWTGLRMILRR